MYEDLSAPTAATANVFVMAALAARENRVLATVNIGGAYLNASMVESGVIVQHMRLDKVMTKILVNRPEVQGFHGRGWIVRGPAGQSTVRVRRSSTPFVSDAAGEA